MKKKQLQCCDACCRGAILVATFWRRGNEKKHIIYKQLHLLLSYSIFKQLVISQHFF